MLFYIGFVLIGIVAGLIAEKFVADKRVPHSQVTMVLLGLVGALLGGSLSLALFRYGRASVSDRFPYGGTREIGQASVPADWLSLIAAMLVAALVIAGYKLAKVLRRGD